MPINRFDTPARTVVKETFVPQAIPSPFDELNMVLQQRQKAYDTNEELIDDSLLKLNVNAIPADIEAREEEIGKFNTAYDDMLKEIGGDLSKAGSKVKEFSRAVDKERRAGKVAAIQSRYDAREAFKKSLEDISTGKDPKVSGEIANTLLQLSDNINSNLTNENGEYNGYQGIPAVQEVNEIERGLELVKSLAADGYENMGLSQDGKFLQTKAGEYITWDRAFKSSYDALSKDSSARNSIKQDIIVETAQNKIYSDDALNGQLDSLKKIVGDAGLKKQIEKVKELPYQQKLEQIDLLSASFAVADQVSFTKSKNKLGQLTEFTYGLVNPENPNEIIVDVPYVSAGKLNSVFTKTADVIGSLTKELSLEERQKRINAKSAGVTDRLKQGINSVMTAFFPRSEGMTDEVKSGLQSVVSTIMSITESDTEIDRNAPNYKSTAANIPGFDSLPEDQKDQAVMQTLATRFEETNVEPTISLNVSSKETEEASKLLYGDKSVMTAKAGDNPLVLNGSASLLNYVTPDGKEMTGAEFMTYAQAGDVNAVTNLGVSTNMNNPIEYGSIMIALNKGGDNPVEYFFAEPTLNIKNSDKDLKDFGGYQLNAWGRQQANSAKYSPTFRKVYTYKGKQMESVYMQATKDRKAYYTIKEIK